ncbi:MAG: glutamyl-tRNA reductase [Pseudomonadales bacterium]
MAILAYGVTYRTAPLEIRERVAFPETGIEEALRALRQEVPTLQEAALISTCNRTELYAVLEADAVAEVSTWFTRHRPITAAELSAVASLQWDDAAVRHLIRVAAGLDSQVLGEPQILGQVKTAWASARRADALGPELNLLSQVALASAKRIRTETDIGRNPVSVAFAAVTMAERLFTDFGSKRALLIGAGEIIQRVLEHLMERRIGSITIANRTLANAAQLAERCNGEAMDLAAIGGALHRFDIVITSTASMLPIVRRSDVETAVHQRRHRPMLLIDLAVPRDVEPDAGDLPDIYLYSVDDLTSVIEDSLRQRRAAAADAEALVSAGAERFMRERRAHAGQSVLRRFRGNAGELQAQELQRALRELQSGRAPEAVLEQLARSLTNKLIHAPTIAMRNAAAEGRNDELDYLKALFALD